MPWKSDNYSAYCSLDDIGEMLHRFNSPSHSASLSCMSNAVHR